MQREPEVIETIYGRFMKTSKRRIDIAFDSENAAISIFHRAVGLFGATHVIDVGANIGLYAIYSVGLPSVKEVTAIEASSATYDELTANIALQTATVRISTHCVAASDRAGTQSFYEYGVMAGDNCIVETSFIGARKESRLTTVTTTPLDFLIQERNSTFAIKIDVEGHELAVLDGAKELLVQSRGFLQIEIIAAENYLAVKQRLSVLGYYFVGQVKQDFYFLHADLNEKIGAFQEIIWSEIRLAMGDLASLRQMRRAILRAARDIGPAAGRITAMAKFKKDPVLCDSPLK